MGTHGLATGQGAAAGTTAGVFLSYRRADPSARIGRLYDRLASRFPGRVFRDIDSLVPAVDFEMAIDDALSRTRVMIAVIGPLWASATDDSGARRLDDPADYVRYEVERALDTPGCSVLPVLAGGASMPRAETLPEPLRRITKLHAISIDDDQGPHFEYDARRVGDAVDALLAEPELEMTLPEPNLSIVPGASGRVPVIVRNPGADDADAVLSVEGPDWATLSPTAARVPAGAELPATLDVHPPRSATLPPSAWTYTVSARVASGTAPPATSGGTLTTEAFHDTQLTLEPELVQARGPEQLTLTVTNGGNVGLKAAVVVDAERLEVDVVDRVSLGPGDRQSHPVHVLPAARRLVGAPVDRLLTVRLVTTSDEEDVVRSATIRQRALVPTWTAALLALLFVVGAAAVWWLAAGQAQSKALPDVTAMTGDAAIQVLDDAGFADVTVRLQESAAEEPGEVLRTEPAPGAEVALDGPVVVVVAEAQPAVTMPDVTDLARDDAVAQLTEQGFTDVRVVSEETTDEKAGEVLRTKPKPGEQVSLGDRVQVVVAKRPAVTLYAIPAAVLGKTWSQALDLLPGPLLIFDKYEASDTVPEGRVIKTDPPVGTEHPADTRVDVYLSTGPETPTEASCELSTASYVLACTGFEPEETVVLYYGAEYADEAQADGDGGVAFSVEGFLGAGQAYQFTATGSHSGRSDTVSGQLPEPSPTPTPEPQQ